MPQTADALRARFAVPGVTIEAGNGGLTRLRIVTDLCQGELYLNGGHLTGFQPRGQQPVLWMSTNSAFAPGKAIRGGVPICYPWFGNNAVDPSLPQHGYARTSEWELRAIDVQPDGAINVILRLPPRPASDDASIGVETHFAALFGSTLEMGLMVSNNGNADFRFEAALHTYFVVGDVHQIAVSGLQGTRFIDKMRGNASFVEQDPAIRFAAETDRVYQSDATCTIDDPVLKRRIVNEKLGSPSTVVWNAFPAKAAAIGLAGDEWQRYVCVETAAIGTDAITLEPGGVRQLGAKVRVEV